MARDTLRKKSVSTTQPSLKIEIRKIIIQILDKKEKIKINKLLTKEIINRVN